mgnify:CR=1 FL=1
MKKQTKLVAVLSTASLLAIGASMTSFAATGWTEENGTWVYYNTDGELATDSWKKSGNSWYWLDENGEMAVDQLIEDDEDYYYVDINGVMATNQWVSIENEDAGEDDEPEHYWYYFQANGKALTNGNNSNVALKTVNGKKYAFDEEGRMLFGWVNKDTAERIDNTDGDAFKEGDYYFGGSDDGAMTTGWLQLDITYDEATNDYEVAPVFNEDEDQTRWFYFGSNGKKVKADDGDLEKEKTINGRRYAFDEYGAMIAEWSLDIDEVNNRFATASANSALGQTGDDYYDLDDYYAEGIGTHSTASKNSVTAKYAQEWRYFQDVENGARVSRGWFKVVPAEYLNLEKYDDDEASWYYADGSGKLYAGEFKTINGKKYAFRDDGRMINGLKFIDDNDGSLGVVADDDETYNFDTEDDFDEHSIELEKLGYKCYYFGDAEDGAMKTGKTTINIDGENFNFYFEKSGGKKGQGVTGEKDDKYYQSGKLLEAGSDEKYQVVKRTVNRTEADGDKVYAYQTLDDVEAFLDEIGGKYSSGLSEENITALNSSRINVNKDADDLAELYIIDYDSDTSSYAFSSEDYFLVNTSGKVIDTNSKSKDGNDYVYVTKKNGSKPGQIVAIYVED